MRFSALGWLILFLQNREKSPFSDVDKLGKDQPVVNKTHF